MGAALYFFGKGGQKVADHQIVKSSTEISVGIVDFLQLISPRHFDGKTLAKMIQEANDTIQGRSERTVENLLDELREKAQGWYPQEIERFRNEIAAFQAQKELLARPYTKCGNESYPFEICDKDPDRPLKIIDQKLYDRAVKEGFPADFFFMSYFDHVTFYCLPDDVNMGLSEFHYCTFAVCRMKGSTFRGSRIYDTFFHSCDLRDVDFSHADLAHSFFDDCVMHAVSFRGVSLKRVFARDSVMENVNFKGAVLDGGSFDRIKAKDIKGLDRATITYSGARSDEVRERQRHIRKALGCPEPDAPKSRQSGKER